MEENKVAQKLMEVLGKASNGDAASFVAKKFTDAILQSPDLRVTLVEPRYYVEEKANEGWPLRIFDRKQGWLFCRFSDEQKAHEYCAWLNSKEPK